MHSRIYLSGRVGFEVAGELAITEREFRGRQERVAFAYLVLERARPVARDELANVLWPEERPAAWQTGLSAVVSRLRSLLAREPVAGLPASMSRGFGQYRLFLPAGVWVDIEAAANAVDAAEAALRATEPRAAFGPATVAATIARRPFLSGDGGGWVAREREMLQRVRVRALDCLARVWLAAGEPQYAVEAAAEAVGADALREASYRLLMQAHVAAGNRAGAMRSYHDLRERLVGELGSDPSQETEALYLEVLG
jgi:DNA-binding SARP family transcriptional activator